jgi:hypothetical protein
MTGPAIPGRTLNASSQAGRRCWARQNLAQPSGTGGIGGHNDSNANDGVRGLLGRGGDGRDLLD